MFEHLLLSSPAEGVYLITINRPHQFNALGRQTLSELSLALLQFEEASENILILSGTGRAFCFGADFLEFQNRDSLPAMLQLFQDLILKLHHCPKITIACMNGFATGAGLDLALACDFRFAAEKIKLAEAYISMGLVPDGGGSFLLPSLIGRSRALEMLLTGEAITAEQGLSMGLVNQVFPPQELISRTIERAVALAAKPQAALRLTKQLLRENRNGDLPGALEKEKKAQLSCFQDPVHLNLVEEFLRKRKKTERD